MTRLPRERRASGRAGQAGITLVELMISLVITSIAVAAAMGLAYSLMNGHRDQARMVNVERAGRVSLEIIADAIRNSSAGVLSGNISVPANLVTSGGSGCAPFAAIDVVNNPDAPDELLVVYASGGVLTSLQAAYDGGTAMTVRDHTGLRPGDFLIVTNLDQGHLVRLEPSVDVDGPDLTLTTSPCDSATVPGGGYPVSSLVIRARVARFYVDTDPSTFGGVPTLMMDPDGFGDDSAEPLAEGIEDLQIAVGVDRTGTGLEGTLEEVGVAADDDEWHYNVAGDTAPTDMSAGVWRALRITLVARSVNEVSKVASFIRPAVEDREGAADPDVFRRRVLSTMVEIRNLEGSR